MHNFTNDYAEGAHPRILKKLLETNLVQQPGYGEDDFSAEAKKMIRDRIGRPEASIYFVSGGTQANLLVIFGLLRVHEAVISAKTGHIYAHETGAIESVGHRVITVETTDGKLRPTDIETVVREHSLRPHVVKPRMVYISNATELGTIYRRSELEALSAYCRANNLLLFMDGARLGNALMASDNDVSLVDVSEMVDVFYIGGTKNGALLGEAIVFSHRDLAPAFDYVLKQKGALLSKGRLLGIQFLELFRDNLYFELALHANQMATKMAEGFREKGYDFLAPSTTNQLFPILPKPLIQQLKQSYAFQEWKEIDSGHSAVRLITSWATEGQVVEEFIQAL